MKIKKLNINVFGLVTLLIVGFFLLNPLFTIDKNDSKVLTELEENDYSADEDDIDDDDDDDTSIKHLITYVQSFEIFKLNKSFEKVKLNNAFKNQFSLHLQIWLKHCSIII